MPKCTVRQEDEADRSHLLVALGLIDGHDPFHLGGHVGVVEDVVLKLDRLLVQHGDDGQLLLLHYPQPNVRLPHGRQFVFNELCHERVVEGHILCPLL